MCATSDTGVISVVNGIVLIIYIRETDVLSYGSLQSRGLLVILISFVVDGLLAVVQEIIHKVGLLPSLLANDGILIKSLRYFVQVIPPKRQALVILLILFVFLAFQIGFLLPIVLLLTILLLLSRFLELDVGVFEFGSAVNDILGHEHSFL